MDDGGRRVLCRGSEVYEMVFERMMREYIILCKTRMSLLQTRSIFMETLLSGIKFFFCQC